MDGAHDVLRRRAVAVEPSKQQPRRGAAELRGIVCDHGHGWLRRAGIETVYQDLAVAPALDIATNIFLGREMRKRGPLGSVLRMLNKGAMRREAARHFAELQIGIRSMAQPVENLSGGQRQGVAVARAATWARRVVIMDEPTAALGVKETRQVLDLIRRVRDRGMPVILISHDMPHVFELADRIQIMRLGRRVAVVIPDSLDAGGGRDHDRRHGRVVMTVVSQEFCCP